MSVDSLVESLSGDPSYIRFLISERPYIRAALEARSYCYDEEYRIMAYPTSVGSSLHLDLLVLEDWLKTLSPQDRKMLNDWADETKNRPSFSSPKMGRVRVLIERFAREQNS